MASINTGVAPLNNYFKSTDFFDVANYPTAKFVGDKFGFEGHKVTEVSGTMTVRGESNLGLLKAIDFNCNDHPNLKREVCGGSFETIIKRSLYEVNGNLANRAALDYIKASIQIEAIKQ